MMIISLIVIADENNGIGKNNQLLCHLPADLKYFKQTTMGHTIVMGRKTYESIGKPLPGRTNIVISRQTDLAIEGCLVLPHLEDAIEHARYSGETELFITGGGTIYELTLPLANKVYLTRIHHRFEADTFFPLLTADDWQFVKDEKHNTDDKNKYDYSFQVFERKIAL
jgi:dihydrofolate reductase